MARYYPRLGSCPACNGTGRAYHYLYNRGGVTNYFIGDNTFSCPACYGTGQTKAERRAEVDLIASAIAHSKVIETDETESTIHFVGAHTSAGHVLRSMLPGDVNCPDCLSEMAAQDAAALPELLRLRKELGLTGPTDAS